MIQPIPAIDPERARWEGDLLLGYAICAGKHRATVEAWDDARKEQNR